MWPDFKGKKILLTQYISVDKPYAHPIFHVILMKAHFTDEETKAWSKDLG